MLIVALWCLALSCCLALLTTPIISKYSIQAGFVDQPDSVRKIHDQPIPRVGGVAVLFSYLVPFAILWLLSKWGYVEWGSSRILLGSILGGALIVFLAGIVDDYMNIRPLQKLGAQVVAAAIVFVSGLRFPIGQNGSEPEIWSFLLTLAWLVGCTNAFNLIDGMDGLASGIAAIATFTIILAAVKNGQMGLALTAIPLLGALIGFLRYNFNPASIFLGDCGSMLIGFLLGCFSLQWISHVPSSLGFTAPLMALAVPILDVALSISRRFLRSRPVFGADRGHIHHRLLDRGMSQRKAALVAYFGAGCASLAALAQNSLHQTMGVPILIFFCLSVWIVIQNLGYLEFSMASRMLLGGGVGKLIDFETKLRHFQIAVSRANTLESLADVVGTAGQEFGFQGIRLALFGKIYLDVEGNCNNIMQIRMPLNHGNYVNFYGAEGRILSLDMNSFLPAVTSSINAKLDQLFPHYVARKENPAPKPKLIKTA